MARKKKAPDFDAVTQLYHEELDGNFFIVVIMGSDEYLALCRFSTLPRKTRLAVLADAEDLAKANATRQGREFIGLAPQRIGDRI